MNQLFLGRNRYTIETGVIIILRSCVVKVYIASIVLLLAPSLSTMQVQGPATITPCTTFNPLSSFVGIDPAQELHAAAREGNADRIQLLLALGTNNDVDGALRQALRNGKKEAASLLLEHGAATDSENRATNRRVHKIVIACCRRFGSHS